MERIRKVKFKPTWMIVGAITGGLAASDLRYASAFFALTVGLWFSYMYGYSRGAREMHDCIFRMIREEVLIPLKEVDGDLAQAGDFAVKPDEKEDDDRR